jgi:hypothetical protein
MNNLPQMLPTIWVYRTKDSREYLFLEFAAAGAGSYVAWGNLCTMDRQNAETGSLAFVLGSLHAFTSRDGSDKSKRLNFLSQKVQANKYDSVSVRLLPTGLLEIIPQRQRGDQYDLLDDHCITFDPVSPREGFVVTLDRAFARVQLPGEAAPPVV